MLQVKVLESEDGKGGKVERTNWEFDGDCAAEWGGVEEELFFEVDGVGQSGQLEEFEDVFVYGETEVSQPDKGLEAS